MQMNFKHIDLMEIEGRLDPEKKPSARGKMYWDTEPGMADQALRLVALMLLDFWKTDVTKILRISDLEEHPSLPGRNGGPSMTPRIPAALKRLARMHQVSLDFDREGVLIKSGSAWIES